MMRLNCKQIRELRRLAHSIKPVVRVGQAGLKATVLDEIDQALEFHELIKIRIGAPDRETRRTMIDEICHRTGSELVQTIGHVAALYRKSRNRRAPVLSYPESSR